MLEESGLILDLNLVLWCSPRIDLLLLSVRRGILLLVRRGDSCMFLTSDIFFNSPMQSPPKKLLASSFNFILTIYFKICFSGGIYFYIALSSQTARE